MSQYNPQPWAKGVMAIAKNSVPLLITAVLHIFYKSFEGSSSLIGVLVRDFRKEHVDDIKFMFVFFSFLVIFISYKGLRKLTRYSDVLPFIVSRAIALMFLSLLANYTYGANLALAISIMLLLPSSSTFIIMLHSYNLDQNQKNYMIANSLIHNILYFVLLVLIIVFKIIGIPGTQH